MASGTPWPDRLALMVMIGWAVYIAHPLFEHGYPSSWDGAAHFVRLKAMTELFLPRWRTDGWCPYWYNGFVPFLFYPKMFFVLAGGLYYALGRLIPLILIYKTLIVSAYALVPPAMYTMARCFRFSRFAALCAALCTLAISSMHGAGLEGLFFIGLIPHGFALPLFLLALGTFHLSLTLGGRFIPKAAILCALVLDVHFISGAYLTLACCIYLTVAWLMHRCRKKTLQRALGISILTAGMYAATIVPAIVYLPLRGPYPDFSDFNFFKDYFGGTYLGGSWINGLAFAFLVGVRRWRFEETFLAALCILTLPFALGAIHTGVPAVDGFLFHILRNRSFPYLGLFAALFAGSVSDATRLFIARTAHDLPQKEGRQWLSTGITWLASAILAASLLADTAARVKGLQHWVQVDVRPSSPVNWALMDAYHWLRQSAPWPAIISFDERLNGLGDPGYIDMSSRIVLEADRFSLQGNQMPATWAHNEEPVRHLHDWDPDRIYRSLVRYNISFLLTWTEDVETNVRSSPHFKSVYRNAKIQIWAVQGHDFRFASGSGVEIRTFEFSPERLAWTVQSDAAERSLTLAVAYHPNWKAWVNNAPIRIRETQDHLMEVQIPMGTSQLIFVFQKPMWENLLAAVSMTALGLSLVWWIRGRPNKRQVTTRSLHKRLV